MDWRDLEDRGWFFAAALVHLAVSAAMMWAIFIFVLPCLDGCPGGTPLAARVLIVPFFLLNLPIACLNAIFHGGFYLLIPADSVLYAWATVAGYRGYQQVRAQKSAAK
jgi:hypothetical protein